MALSRRAVIDIGTNSVKLLVADVDGASVVPIFEDSEQTRLGKGLYETQLLQPGSIEDTARAVAQFAEIARLKKSSTIRVIATSAAREARNRQELLQAVETAASVPVEVISGEQEARWVYQGVRSDSSLAGQRLMILDAGGGSTEFIIGDGEQPEFAQSFSIGSVRLLESMKPSDPPAPAELKACREWLRTTFQRQIKPVMQPVLDRGRVRPRLVGTGGAASILARMEYSLDKYHRHEIDGARMTIESVERWMEKLWAMPLADRKTIVGLPKKRADVILMGMAIYEVVLREFGFAEFRASTRGLRFAAVMQAAEFVPAS